MQELELVGLQYHDGKVPSEVQLAHEIERLQRDLAKMQDLLELKRYLLEYLTSKD